MKIVSEYEAFFCFFYLNFPFHSFFTECPPRCHTFLTQVSHCISTQVLYVSYGLQRRRCSLSGLLCSSNGRMVQKETVTWGEKMENLSFYP